MSIQPLTRNVTALYRRAHAAGLADAHVNWYATAYDAAHGMAFVHGVPVHVAVGVIAALSPRMEWDANLRIAERMLASGGTLERGALTDNLRKARAIVAGADPLDVMTAPKTSNFHRAIISRGDDGIVIDRHAIDVAHAVRHTDANRPTASSAKRYEAYALCYRRAAVILSDEFGPVTPSQVQGVTWEAWRLQWKGRRA
jgi:hypothetical protein